MTQLVLDAFPEHVDDAALADCTLDTETGTVRCPELSTFRFGASETSGWVSSRLLSLGPLQASRVWRGGQLSLSSV